MEEWALSDHLCEYTTDAPDVNRARVTLGPEEDFRRPVPQRHNLRQVQQHEPWAQHDINMNTNGH